MNTKNKKFWYYFWKISSIGLLGTGLAFNVVYANNFVENKYERVENVRDSGFLADSFFTIDGEGFETKIGLKGKDVDVD